MIEWKEIDNWPFYVDERCTVVGTIAIDRSKGPKLFRMRVQPNHTNPKILVLRIKKGSLEYAQTHFRGHQLELYLDNLLLLAEKLRLTPCGTQKDFTIHDNLMKTRL